MNSTTAHPPIESLPAASLTHDDARAIVDLLVQLWPRPEETLEDATERIKDQWRDYDGPEDHAPRYFCMREGDRMIALAHALPRTVGTADGQITVMGLARVCVAPEHQDRKLGRAIVEAALALVDQGVFRYALFQTTTPVRPFYEKLGSCEADNPLVNSLADEPDKSPFWLDEIMRYPSTPGWPEGQIDMRGPAY